MALLYMDGADVTTKFHCITEKLLLLTSTKISDKKLISTYLNDVNELDYRCLTIVNDDAVLLLVNQLCGIVLPTETALVQSTCKLLANLIQNNVKICGRTLTKCKSWILEGLEFSALPAQNDILFALKSFLMVAEFNDLNQYLPSLLGNRALLKRHLDALNVQWSELNYNAVGCLEGILVNKQNGISIPQEFLCTIKDIIFSVISLHSYPNDDKPYMSKILSSCLHMLHLMMVEKMIPTSTVLIGEILGVVQAFLFYGIKDYPPIKLQLLRPAAMNLPERMHTVPKCKNLKNQKAKSKKLPLKKTKTETKNVVSPESKGICKCSSDSDTSDTESNNLVYVDSKVRMEAVHLLQILVETSHSREIFGYWPQIVATGSRNDAHVLTRSLLKEPVCKVKQNVLSTLTEMLIGAKPFLMHAEDVQQTSFITFFGTVCLMVKELHFTLSLILSSEKNIVVLTHALKCAAALIQGTPYARLKPGLVTKLMRNCKLYLFHKNPTIRVAVLSTFEALASCDPITPEILAILAKHSINGMESIHMNASSVSDVGTEEEEEVEVDVEDINSSSAEKNTVRKIINDTNISLLVHVCLENISNVTISTPVRLQSLKLIGRMAFNTGSLVFPYVEKVTTTLVSVLQESEVQVIQHACRALEIMAGCLTNSGIDQNDILFWNIIFEPMMTLVQNPQTILREAACDCLGSIGSNIFIQFTRQRTVLLITVLFSAVRDEESAVRAAGLRALGMLVTVPSLEEETGFLMDLADIIFSTADDKNLGVRVKGAWALANLCDCLLRRKAQEDSEPLPLEVLLPKLYQVSIQASKDSDKVKCNAVRALGAILHLCPDRHILHDTSVGLDTLITCAILGNDMKVRWNACRALGLVLSCNPDNILPPLWKGQVYPALCSLICDSPNFKVRTNAAWALYSCNSYDKYITMLWKTIVLAFENSQHVPSYVEYPHRDALVQQLCLTLSHVAACTEVSELRSVWAEIGDHVQDISNYMKQFQETIVPEKLDDLIKAKSQLQQYVKNAPTSEERNIAQKLASIFERTNHYDNLDIITRTM